MSTTQDVIYNWLLDETVELDLAYLIPGDIVNLRYELWLSLAISLDFKSCLSLPIVYSHIE